MIVTFVVNEKLFWLLFDSLAATLITLWIGLPASSTIRDIELCIITYILFGV